jgi:aryl-alcohol dehydrogenase-like predicted oxidoreductase
MELRRLGQTEILASVLGIGCAEIGFEKTENRIVDELLGVASEAGVNVIDTAAMYADSESKLGRALDGRRDKFFIFTKCGLHVPTRLSPTGLLTRASAIKDRLADAKSAQTELCWRPDVLAWNIEQSLRRLKTERLDLLLLHSCSEELLKRGDVIEVLQRAKQSGKARYIGYSGDGTAELYAIESRRFDAVELSLNIADQEAIETLLPAARQHRLGVVAKRPIANALWRQKKRPDSPHNSPYWDRLRALGYDFLSDEHDIETALRFTIAIPGVHTAIVGTTNPQHMRRNIEAISVGGMRSEFFGAIRRRWIHTELPNRHPLV